MTFGQPLFLFAFILLPLAVLFLWWVNRQRQAALARIGELRLLQQLSERVNWHGRKWQTRLWVLALALALLALARPQWGREEQIIRQEGVQVMVILDVSQSMLAADLRPNRLTRAKLEISDLMNRLGGDDVGLVLFSGASFIQFPLTSDYATARSYLDSAGPHAISRPGTEIGQAIRTAMQGFDDQRASQKVMVIMTDGENHESDPVPVAMEAAAQGVLIYTIGFGNPDGEPVPQFDEDGELAGFKRDEAGEVILSRLDEATLQQIAQAANGRYFRASVGGSELDILIEDLANLQKAESERNLEVDQVERFQIFLFAAVAALLVIEIIPERRRYYE